VAAVIAEAAQPSDFNIFTHSMKDRFDEIFADVRRRLPTVGAFSVAGAHALVGTGEVSHIAGDDRDSDEDDVGDSVGAAAPNPLDLIALKSALLAPLARSMQLVSAVDAGLLLYGGVDPEDDDVPSNPHIVKAAPAAPAAAAAAAAAAASYLESDDDDDDDEPVSVRAPRRPVDVVTPASGSRTAASAPLSGATLSGAPSLSMDSLRGIDLDALLRSLERGSVM
jgi:hypothetical protein